MCSERRWTASGLVVTVLAAALLGTSSGCQVAADGSNLQGVRLYQQGQFGPALQEFQQAVATHPKNADGYYNMAATLHKMGTQSGDRDLLNQAETLYNQCLDLDADHTDCHRGLAVLLVETERPDSAFTLLKNWAAANPDRSDTIGDRRGRGPCR